MAEIIAFESLRKGAEHCEVLALFRPREQQADIRDGQGAAFDFPSARPFITGNLSDLFEQANAVAMRHYDGDQRVPRVVADKCLELLKALADHAQPE
ncbi:hypothetical protein [Microvirga subterranea]|uniref:Uncharacterized protein n=1 Tax=Microvirga subterranea TaxID=186651 RepID=A0A370H8I9_9HYPH|nr:hypothetical protein [Microvirga subterranea]RDI52560.1 hypothetical protein DES45_11421 [Microvirga subterranea]